MKYPKQPQPVKAGWRILLLLAMTMFTFGPAGITPVHAENCYDFIIVSNPAVGGTVNVNPLPNCGGKYTEGTAVTLTAVPNSKYNLKNWSGDATGSTNPVVVVVNGNKSVTARFVPKNDDYDLATQILGLTYSDTLNTTEALAAFEDDPLDPNPVGPCLDGDTFFAGHKTLWYQYRPLVNESIQVDTLGSREIINSNQDLDTYVAVWKLVQENPRVLELVDCNDDDPTFAGSVTSRLTFVALANTTYYFQAAQYNGVPGDELTRKSPKAANIKFNVNITNIDVVVGGILEGRYYLARGEELREYYNVSGGPVKVAAVQDVDIVTAIRLQSFTNNTLYSFVETMGVPQGLLSHKYYFPTYNNTWAPLNSQVRFGNLDAAQTRIRVTIGGVNVWEQDVPGAGGEAPDLQCQRRAGRDREPGSEQKDRGGHPPAVF